MTVLSWLSSTAPVLGAECLEGILGSLGLHISIEVSNRDTGLGECETTTRRAPVTMLGAGNINENLGLLTRVLGAQHILVKDEAKLDQGLLGVQGFSLQVSCGLLRVRREDVIVHDNEREQGLREVIALADGGQVRSVLTEAEGARVLEEGVVLLAVQASVITLHAF